MGALAFLLFFFYFIYLKVNCGLLILCYLYEGRKWFQCIGYDYTAYIDYTDLAVCCPQKGYKFNHSHTLNWCTKLDIVWKRCTILFQIHPSNLKVTRDNYRQLRGFPYCNSCLNALMDLKWCTRLDVVKESCPITFRGHPSNFEVKRAE